MAEDHPFTTKVEPRIIDVGRHRWNIFRSQQPLESSGESYATKREALAAADKRVQKLVADWRIGK
jgi:hypothetical protein